jgi:predicted PurR-regulated permease PerM
VIPERLVRFSLRSVAAVIGLVLVAWALLHVLSIAREVIIWILVAVFLALAMNPAVESLQRRGIRRRGLAVGITFVAVIAVIGGIGATFIPTLVDQVNAFVHKLPDYIHDLTKGKGKLGFLETKYHVVEKVREAVNKGGAQKLLGFSGAAISITRSVITYVVATITITFLTFFMLLEGPAWLERVYSLLPEKSQPRWRAVGHEIYRTVGGYVSGNLLISLIAGVTYGIVLFIFGVPYAVALALIVGILDLIPLAGATLATIIVGAVAFIHSIPAGIAIVVYAVVYQQIENHLLQPLIYGRTVQLSPLAVLIAVLIGASIAGVLGALAAIPVAGTIQILILDWRRHRRARLVEEPVGGIPPPPAPAD